METEKFELSSGVMAIIAVICAALVFGTLLFTGPKPEAIKPAEGSMKTYYELQDGTWLCDGHTYQYRLVVTGRMPNAAKDSSFTYLSNIKEISFEEAYKAAGISSNTEDYFKVEDAVLVNMK